MQVKFILLLADLTVGLAFSWAGHVFYGVLGDPDVKNFVCVVMAVSSSLVFRRVRQWLFKYFYGWVVNRTAKCHSRIKGMISEKEFDVMAEIIASMLEHLERRLMIITTCFVPLCFCVAGFCGALFWLGIPATGSACIRWLHMLLLPSIVYFVSIVVCCACSWDQCDETFGEYERSVEAREPDPESREVERRLERAFERIKAFRER